MRKLFFLLVLVSGMLTAQTPNATNTQTIGKFLKLSKVPSGLETDKVLVRGTDGIVKSVPRSQFGGGSSTPTLQQVLSPNGIAIDRSIDLRASNTLSSTDLSPGVVTVTTDDLGNGDTARLQIGASMITYNGNSTTNTNGALRFPNQNYATNVIPISVNGNLADSDGNIEIEVGNQNLQSVLNSGSVAQNISMKLQTPTFWETEISSGNVTSRSLGTNVYSQFDFANLYFVDDNGTLSTYSRNGIMSQNPFDSSKFNQITLNDRAAEGGAFYSVDPAKPAGGYILATKDDIKLKEYTVATLPAGTKGDVAYVNDASSPAFLATVVGGGSAVVRVFHNGSNWIVQ